MDGRAREREKDRRREDFLSEPPDTLSVHFSGTLVFIFSRIRSFSFEIHVRTSLPTYLYTYLPRLEQPTTYTHIYTRKSTGIDKEQSDLPTYIPTYLYRYLSFLYPQLDKLQSLTQTYLYLLHSYSDLLSLTQTYLYLLHSYLPTFLHPYLLHSYLPASLPPAL